MDFRESAEEQSFRVEAREWLGDHLVGEFADARGLGGLGREHEGFDVRLAWEQLLGKAGWTCLGWPAGHGGRGATVAEQVIWAEEYTRAQAPARVNHIAEQLLGPTIIAFGTPQQQRRFLPPIVRAEELWCQGYSEPDAGSDLANVKTRAVLDGDEWVVTGQKVWTSLAPWAQWCFVVCRTNAGAAKHKGLSYLLVPMDQPGIEIRPIEQMTGGSEFNEVFFDGARTAREHVVGEVDDGWRVAMGTLGFERGVSTLANQIGYEAEFATVLALARRTGKSRDPVLRQRLADAWIGLRLIRLNALRTMSTETPGPEASIGKLQWASWHRSFGELAVDVAGADIDRPEHDDLRTIFLFSRADTIYGGSNQIQRNVIGERVLGLPKEPA
ncbi:MAG: acyl-CoA dehydrogenase [Acidimicrobiales bacterium]|nr:acyl-CoA dehydrogenase [Acidimicrobiales bacterium]